MDSLNTESHSFVIKIQLEAGDGGRDKLLLRGHITHVSTGERRYFNNLAEISNFISDRLGLRQGLHHRLLGKIGRLLRQNPRS